MNKQKNKSDKYLSDLFLRVQSCIIITGWVISLGKIRKFCELGRLAF